MYDDIDTLGDVPEDKRGIVANSVRATLPHEGGLIQGRDSLVVPGLTKGKTEESTGGSVSYYKVGVERPVSGGEPYRAECLDVARALDMNVDEFNMFKAIWRTAAARTLGRKKAGNEARYDAEKIQFYADLNLKRYTEGAS